MAILSTVAATAQTTIYSEDFEGGALPAGFTLYNVDGLTPDPMVADITDAWVVIGDATNGYSAYSTSWYAPPGQADDWIWTPAISLTSDNTLSWWATSLSQAAAFRDGYEVYVAAAPTSNPASAVKVFSIAAEAYGWVNHTVNLGALGLSNQSYYIGFRNNSNDKLALAIDDILVTEPLQHDAAITAIPRMSEYYTIPLEQARPYNLGATVHNDGAATLTSVSLSANIRLYPPGDVVSSQTSAPVANMLKNTDQVFTIPGYTPTAVGAFEVEYVTHTTPADENTLNDTAYTFRFIDDSLFYRDNNTFAGAFGLPDGASGYLGQMYELVKGGKLASVQAYLDTIHANEQYAFVLWDTDATGKPNQIVASTDTLSAPIGLSGAIYEFPMFGGEKALQPGKYVATAVQFNHNIAIGASTGIFTPGTTWIQSPLIPTGWVNNEALGAQFQLTYVLRLNLHPLCQPIALLTQQTDAACNGGNGTALAYVGGIVPPPGPFTYKWSNGATTQEINAPAGTYSVTATDPNGCSNETTVSIVEPTALAAGVVVSDPAVFGQDGSIAVTPSGGTSPYTILWSNGAVTTTISAAPGIYSFELTDANGCKIQSLDYEIHAIAQPMAGDIVVENAKCAGETGTLSANASGGVAPYTYLWSNGATTLAITVSTGGSYSVVVTDQVGTSITFSSSLTIPTAIAATTSSTNATCQTCADGTASVSASGGTGTLTYSWDSGATTATATGLLAGSHSCTITDANNCQLAETVTVAFNVQPLTTNITTQWGGCPGNPATLSITVGGGATPYTYAWSNGATASSTTVFTSGNYCCTVTDFLGSTIVDCQTFTQPAALAAPTTTTNATCSNCPNGSATVAPSGGTGPYTYSWSNGGTTATISNVPPGQYSVVVTDANGCTITNGATVSFTIRTDEAGIVSMLDVFPNPASDFVRVNAQLVERQQVVLKLATADGRLIYEKTLGEVADFSQTVDLSKQPAGVYLLSVQTAGGVVSRPVVKE